MIQGKLQDVFSLCRKNRVFVNVSDDCLSPITDTWEDLESVCQKESLLGWINPSLSCDDSVYEELTEDGSANFVYSYGGHKRRDTDAVKCVIQESFATHRMAVKLGNCKFSTVVSLTDLPEATQWWITTGELSDDGSSDESSYEDHTDESDEEEFDEEEFDEEEFDEEGSSDGSIVSPKSCLRSSDKDGEIIIEDIERPVRSPGIEPRDSSSEASASRSQQSKSDADALTEDLPEPDFPADDPLASDREELGAPSLPNLASHGPEMFTSSPQITEDVPTESH